MEDPNDPKNMPRDRLQKEVEELRRRARSLEQLDERVGRALVLARQNSDRVTALEARIEDLARVGSGIADRAKVAQAGERMARTQAQVHGATPTLHQVADKSARELLRLVDDRRVAVAIDSVTASTIRAVANGLADALRRDNREVRP